MIHKKKCPILVDGWMELITSEIYIGFQFVFTLWLCLLTIFWVFNQSLLPKELLIMLIIFAFILFMVIYEIFRLKKIKTKTINGLKNTNKIRKEWENNLDRLLINFLRNKIRK